VLEEALRGRRRRIDDLLTAALAAKPQHFVRRGLIVSLHGIWR
jgi:hypothetical protein